VLRGQRVFGEEVVSRLPKLIRTGEAFDGKQYHLTEKEVEIITCVANGMSNKDIAAQLFLHEGTVRNYISVILEKLALRDRTQLAIFYYTKMQ
jgi:DNA-binding NarL/FixJ family response regulator